MPFSTFRQLFAEAKWLKLIEVFGKINSKFAHTKWLFTCCRNYSLVKTIYYNTLDMIINTRGFLFNLLEDDKIDEKPACYKHAPSICSLDYLVKDFQYLLNLIIKSVKERRIYEHAKLNVLLELAHSLYNLLESFHKKYISNIYNEK